MAALICAAMVSGVSLGAGASWHDLTRGNDAAYGFQAYAGPHIATHFAIVAAFQGLLTPYGRGRSAIYAGLVEIPRVAGGGTSSWRTGLLSGCLDSSVAVSHIRPHRNALGHPG